MRLFLSSGSLLTPVLSLVNTRENYFKQFSKMAVAKAHDDRCFDKDKNTQIVSFDWKYLVASNTDASLLIELNVFQPKPICSDKIKLFCATALEKHHNITQ